jgi:hypothetical protein
MRFRPMIPDDYHFLQQGAIPSRPPPQVENVAGIAPLWEELSRELVIMGKAYPSVCGALVFSFLLHAFCQICLMDKYAKGPLRELASRLGGKFAAIGLQLSYYDHSDYYYYAAGTKAGIRWFDVYGITIEKTGQEQYGDPNASMGVASPAPGSAGGAGDGAALKMQNMQRVQPGVANAVPMEGGLF